MKCRRLIEYEAATREEVERGLAKAMLSKAPEFKPGETYPGFGPYLNGASAPQVTVRLLNEEWIDG